MVTSTSKPVDQKMSKPKVLFKARFSELVALNFSIDPTILEPRVPKGLELDFFKDETYVSLVAMMLRDVRVFGFPIHIASGFEEFNLRFYVRRKVGDTYQKGACFLKDYVSGSAAAWILGRIFKAEFGRLKLKHKNSGFDPTDEGAIPEVDYQWKVDDHWNRIRIKARERIQRTGTDTKVGFILNHNNAYSSRDGMTLEYAVARPQWQVWNAAQANFTCDVKRLFGAEFVKPLARRPASVFVTAGSEVVYYRPTAIAR